MELFEGCKEFKNDQQATTKASAELNGRSENIKQFDIEEQESSEFSEIDYSEIETMRESGARNPHAKNAIFLSENSSTHFPCPIPKRINMKCLLNMFSYENEATTNTKK